METTAPERTVGTQQEYAKHLGCSEPYVSKLKRQQLLVFVRTPEGMRVDFAASDALVAAARDPNKEGGRERWRRAKGRPAASDTAAGGDLQGDADAGEPDKPLPAQGPDRELYNERLRAQVRREAHLAAVAELELAERAGMLMLVSEARDRIQTYARVVRDNVMAIEERMASRLPPEQCEILREELKAALHAIKRDLAAESGDPGDAGETAGTG